MEINYDNIKVIGFDADDTLWVNETYFREAEEEIQRLLSKYETPNSRGARHRALPPPCPTLRRPCSGHQRRRIEPELDRYQATGHTIVAASDSPQQRAHPHARFEPKPDQRLHQPNQRL